MQINWDKYLKQSEIKKFRKENKLTPREVMIITKAVQEEKSLQDANLPFDITDYDKNFYEEEKSDYEKSKKSRGGKPSNIDFINDW